jgi:hypothetical protein
LLVEQLREHGKFLRRRRPSRHEPERPRGAVARRRAAFLQHALRDEPTRFDDLRIVQQRQRL